MLTATRPTNIRVTLTGVSLPPVAKTVLTSADFQYLGALRLPATGVTRTDFAYGQIAGRVVNGQVRLFVSGNVTRDDPIYEFSDPGGYNTTYTKAPTMPLVRNWGDIYGTKRTTWDTKGVEQPMPAMYPGNLFWHEGNQLLYWSYFNNYNVTVLNDWCLGASRLTSSGAVAFGPWRPSGGGKVGSWRATRFAQHPITGEMLCGTTIQSGAGKAPWGPDLWGGDFPTETTPAGYGAPDLPVLKYLTYYPMFGNINQDGTYKGALRACRRPGDYFFEAFSDSGSGLTEIDPVKNGGVGAWTVLDRWGSVLWLELPTKRGVIFTGNLASGHVWYSNAGVGHRNCSHGFPPPAGMEITGPVSTAGYPALFIYDPDDLDAVNVGTKTDYSITPREIVNMEARFGVKTSPITGVGSAKALVGSYFEPRSRRLYIAAPEADNPVPGYHIPLVHVFQVAA